jgi:hypothetical protein
MWNAQHQGRARQFTGLRIQRPDLSDKTDEQKALWAAQKINIKHHFSSVIMVNLY